MKTSNYNPDLYEYIELVESGKITACKEQHQLVAYVRHVLEETDVYFDHDQFEKYLSYQKYFPFDLYPWEKFVFGLHCCTYKPNGLPRWNDLLVLMGRGGGKNGYLAFEDFCLLTPTNGIRNYHIDICANSEEQAKTSFVEIHDMLDNSQGHDRKVLKANFYWNQTVIRNRKTGSELKYRTNNPKGKDGLRSGKVDFDEPHAYENWDNINVFTTGLGKKPHPRRTYTSTDGDVREGPLDQLKELSRQILNGETDDNGFLPFICKLDNEAEVHDEKMWNKANPSLMYKPDLLDQMRREYVAYKLDPVTNRSFMTKRMNIPKGLADVEVTSWENILKTNRERPDLEGKTCVCGIDFTKTTDFVSAVLTFRVDGTYYCIHHSWLCTRSNDIGRIKIPLDEMVERGLLTMVDDVEVSPYLITDWIQQMREKYYIAKIAVDSYRFSLLSRALEGIGYYAKDGDVKMVRPSDIMLVQTNIASLFARGLIVWGDDPLMRWFTNNTKLEPAANNNYKYGKIEPKSRKTDGFMAFVHSMTIEEEIPEDFSGGFLEPIVF